MECVPVSLFSFGSAAQDGSAQSSPLSGDSVGPKEAAGFVETKISMKIITTNFVRVIAERTRPEPFASCRGRRV